MDSWPPQPVEQHRNWLDLPRDVTSSILRRLNPIEILTNTQKVCLHWRNICKDPSMWRTLNMMGNFVCLLKYKRQCDLVRNICRTIDLSCGQLVAIEIGHFCDENLLKYITERSSGLRHLGLSCCEIPVEGFSEAVANIPLLDELELSYCLWTENFLEAVGRSCPHLKSLKLRSEFSWDGPFEGCDLLAVAIAENVSGLVRLVLDGNNLTNDGLQAILDGCPHLQSLELRGCRHVSLRGDFGRKCSERIKSLRWHYWGDQETARILDSPSHYGVYFDVDYEIFGLEYVDEDEYI